MPQDVSDFSDAFNAQNSGQQNTLIAKFYWDAVPDEAATNGWVEDRPDPITGEMKKFYHKGEGRPIYREVEHIEIRPPGEKDEIRRRQIRETDKVRFPREWAAFQNGQKDPLIGTPLEKLPFLTKSQVLEFAAVGIRTAENLRDCSDVNGQRFMDFNRLRKRVTDFLAIAEGNAPFDKLRAENDALAAQLADQARVLKEQGEQIAALIKKK